VTTRNMPPVYHVRAQQRAKARQDRARDHLARFITTGQAIPHSPYRFADLPQDAYGRDGNTAPPPWRPAPWATEQRAA
jgi:hypothetical protein